MRRMLNFDYYQPTDIRFGWGRIDEVGEVVSDLGDSCLLVTVSTEACEVLAPLFQGIKNYLGDAGVKVFHYDGVVPNPTTPSINKGAEMAEEREVDVVLGVGGGSSMDTAKAISVGATHPGEAWDYRLFTDKEVTEKVLPVVAVPTTAGTGAEVSPVSVLTNPDEKLKFAILDKLLCPQTALVDPELTVTVPKHVTASTGFDVLTHAFESCIHKDASAYVDMHALEAIERVVEYLPVVLEDGSDREGRIQMSYASLLGGLCIANSGTVLPHGIGMAIGGNKPDVMHGEGLAAVYPGCMEYTWNEGVEKFATLGRILNPELEGESDDEAAERSCDEMEGFLESIGMSYSLKDWGMDADDLPAIADDSVKLPDYEANPKVPNRDEILKILEKSYEK